MIYPNIEYITVKQKHKSTNKCIIKETTVVELASELYDEYKNIGLNLKEEIIFVKYITSCDVDPDYNYYFENDEIDKEVEKELNAYLYADKISLLKVISPIECFIIWFQDEYDENEYSCFEEKRDLYCSTLQSTIFLLKNKFNFKEIDGEGGRFI